MYKIPIITTNPNQEQILVMEDGTKITFQIRYSPLQNGWFLSKLQYGDFTLNGLRICNSPNMLHQFINQLTFGLACFSNSTREPMLQTDFILNNSELYIITQAEAQLYLESLTNA